MGGMSGSAMSRYTPIDWRDFGRIRIQGLIGGPIKPCSDCHIDLTLEKFGLCKKCWDNVCRKLKICAVCYEPTLSHLDFPPDVIPYDKGSGEWVKKKLDNWKKTYCSEKCRGIAKSREWRKENPEKKQMSNLKYLKDIEKDLKKTLKEKK